MKTCVFTTYLLPGTPLVTRGIGDNIAATIGGNLNANSHLMDLVKSAVGATQVKAVLPGTTLSWTGMSFTMKRTTFSCHHFFS